MRYIVKTLNFMTILPSVQNRVCHLCRSCAFTEKDVPDLEKDSNYVDDILEKRLHNIKTGL